MTTQIRSTSFYSGVDFQWPELAEFVEWMTLWVGTEEAPYYGSTKGYGQEPKTHLRRTEGRSRGHQAKAKQKGRPGRPADYTGAAPEQVAEAVLRFLAQPGIESDRSINPGSRP